MPWAAAAASTSGPPKTDPYWVVLQDLKLNYHIESIPSWVVVKDLELNYHGVSLL